MLKSILMSFLIVSAASAFANSQCLRYFNLANNKNFPYALNTPVLLDSVRVVVITRLDTQLKPVFELRVADASSYDLLQKVSARQKLNEGAVSSRDISSIVERTFKIDNVGGNFLDILSDRTPLGDFVKQLTTAARYNNAELVITRGLPHRFRGVFRYHSDGSIHFEAKEYLGSVGFRG